MLYLIVLTKFIRVFILIKLLNWTQNFLLKTRAFIKTSKKRSRRYDLLIDHFSLNICSLVLFIDLSLLMQQRIKVFSETRNLSDLSSSRICWSLNSFHVTPDSITR